MNLELRKTNDGSLTLYRADIDETYHSIHGAKQESEHVFIKNGLNYLEGKGITGISILEIGFGTGYNALLTQLRKAKETNVAYHGLELYPVPITIIEQLAEEDNFLNEHQNQFLALHKAPWGEHSTIADDFKLLKTQVSVFDYAFPVNHYQLIYFDAFGFRAQEEMWSDVFLQQCYQALQANGVFVTYAAKGSIRRSLEKAGFTCERLPGPPGKREMLRAVKL